MRPICSNPLDHRNVTPARRRGLQCGRSHLCALNKSPIRTNAPHRAPGLRAAPSPLLLARRGSRNSLGNSPPTPAVACDAQPGHPGGAVSAPRLARRRQSPHRSARCKNDVRPFLNVRLKSTAVVEPSTPPRRRAHDRRQEKAPAACGSSTSIRRAPDLGYRGSDPPSDARRTAHCRTNRIWRESA